MKDTPNTLAARTWQSVWDQWYLALAVVLAIFVGQTEYTRIIEITALAFFGVHLAFAILCGVLWLLTPKADLNREIG